MRELEDVERELPHSRDDVVLAISRERPDVARYLAAGYLESGHPGQALHALEGFSNEDAHVAFLRGHAWLQLEKLVEAKEAFSTVLAIRPDWAAAWAAAGLASHRAGHYADAERAYARALEIRPGDADSAVNLAILLGHTGRTADEIAAWERARAAAPMDAQIAFGLGNARARVGDAEGAESAYRAALSLAPELHDVRQNLGNLLAKRRRFEEAEQIFQALVVLEPERCDAWRSLVAVRIETMNKVAAEGAARAGLERFPGDPELNFSLASICALDGRFVEAQALYEGLLRCAGTRARARIGLAGLAYEFGHSDDAFRLAQAAFTESPDSLAIANNLALYAQYSPECGGAARLAAARAAGKAIEAAKPPASPFVGRTVGSMLRIGFVSGDLHTHPVSIYLAPILEGLDKKQVETICYSNGRGDDAATARLRSAATYWRSIWSLDDVTCLETIRSDGPDALFDLSGHTPRNRLPVFAARAARAQLSWAGYCAPSGVAALDYVLADAWLIPFGAETDFSERVVRMDGSCLPFSDPFDDMPNAALRRPGPIRFCSYNNAAKLSPETLAAWAEILARVPDATLTLRHRQYGIHEVTKDILGRFESLGIDQSRLIFRPGTDRRTLIESYSEVDIGLDPFPFSGGVTTLEALWMGVPVVTLASRRAIGRLGVSILSVIGRPELIASEISDYVDCAVGLALDAARLAAMRASIRSELQASQICDKRRTAAAFLKAIEHVI